MNKKRIDALARRLRTAMLEGTDFAEIFDKYGDLLEASGGDLGRATKDERFEMALGAIAQRLMRAKAPISVRTRHNARIGITNASFMVEGRHGLAFAFPEDGRGLCALFDRTGRADFYRFTLVELPLPASDTVS